MTLKTELSAFQAEWAARVGPAIAGTIAADNDRLATSGFAAGAMQAGDAFPALTLPDQLGRPVDLGALYAGRALVVTFYRGGWCPYCSLELRAYQAQFAAIEAAGATLVAVSPETPDNALTTIEKNGIGFPVLSDVEGRLADALGIRFPLSPAIRALYERFGHDLPTHNGDGGWSLPMPATYVVAPGGRVALAHVDPDYRTRLEPSAAVAALRGLRPRVAA